ncbi:MAG: hypothetical protein QOG57_4810 [Pseudonocardiales bacterium]|nr:hypothetical protein [Pseudonocardiales bacterium]
MRHAMRLLRYTSSLSLMLSVTLAAMCLTVMLFPGSQGVAFAQTRGVSCRTINVTVALTASGPHNQRIQGTLCGAPGDGGRPVQILVHGFTLTRTYWDFPVDNDRYSYVKAAIAQGYSTLAIDRIGVGGSSTPATVEVTLDSNVQTVHDVVRAVRDGSVTGSPVNRVVLVGHSFGSAISVTEAGRFHDVDAVVATSFLHTPGPGAGLLIGSAYPAQLDPQFSSRHLPPGYITTLPGTRSQFYSPKDTDPRVLAYDEAHKGTGTEGEIATFGAYLSPVYDALTVTAPVLFAVGSADAYFCTLSLPCTNGRLVAAREQPYFTDTARLSGYVLPGAGHNMALELNSPLATTAILNWINHPTRGVPGVGLDLPVTRALLSPVPHI